MKAELNLRALLQEITSIQRYLNGTIVLNTQKSEQFGWCGSAGGDCGA